MFATPVSPRLWVSKRERDLQPTDVEAPKLEWLDLLMTDIGRYQQAIQQCPIIVHLSHGTFSHSQVRDCLIQLYPFVKMIPEWVSLLEAKAVDGGTCAILSRYGRMMSWYVPQWVHMAEGFGLHRQELFESAVRVQVKVLNQYMWFVSRQGSVVEGMMSLGYAIGQVTRSLAPFLLNGLKQYEQRTGRLLTQQATSWLRHHVQSSDWYSRECVKIVERTVLSRTDQDAVSAVDTRSLAYLLMILEECGVMYDPWNSYRHIGHTAA